MAMQVYLSGTDIIVNKSGESSLTIPQYRAKFVLFGVEPISDLNGYTNVKIIDTVTQDEREDLISEVQDVSGVYVGTNLQVFNYLGGIIDSSDSYITKVEPCTAANQETIIAQNEVIKAELKDIRAIDEESQDIIKKELKENNKYLRKIYQ